MHYSVRPSGPDQKKRDLLKLNVIVDIAEGQGRILYGRGLDERYAILKDGLTEDEIDFCSRLSAPIAETAGMLRRAWWMDALPFGNKSKDDILDRYVDARINALVGSGKTPETAREYTESHPYRGLRELWKSFSIARKYREKAGAQVSDT
jgi:hypothetical protein